MIVESGSSVLRGHLESMLGHSGDLRPEGLRAEGVHQAVAVPVTSSKPVRYERCLDSPMNDVFNHDTSECASGSPVSRLGSAQFRDQTARGTPLTAMHLCGSGS